jgi:hypothetical protein
LIFEHATLRGGIFFYTGDMERRYRENNRVLFDYKDLFDKRKSRGKVLLKMKKGPLTYTTTSGTRFFKQHPFQWVGEDESVHLLSLPEDGYVFFVRASVEDAEDYYDY